MNKRTYLAPLGATSITVNGNTYEVDAKGRIECDDDAAHADLLSHGYTYGDAPAAVATTYSAEQLAGFKSELEEHAARLQSDFDARAANLEEREAALAAARADLSAAEAALTARADDLANKETDLTIRTHAVEQREAALATSAPPPPPPVDAKPAKGK